MKPLFDLPPIEEMRAEAAGQGFRFMDKLVLEWRSGANRFDQPGETILGAFQDDDLVAVGGLNRDPYADQAGIGRLRHLYVMEAARRSGVGSDLVRQLLDAAKGSFHLVRLWTDTQAAANFYVSIGFRAVQDKSATHVMAI